MIDSRLINEAKEKLGDRNADLMVEALNITDYDSRNMKCRCVVHEEKTPSMIYDRKRFRFKCFGCGASFDVISSFIEGQGMTFNQAAEKLFEAAEMEVPMPEVGLRDPASVFPRPSPTAARTTAPTAASGSPPPPAAPNRTVPAAAP